jgi:catechol 2,3-dioxygenase-like lactoylglutathione lyase family enzyme
VSQEDRVQTSGIDHLHLNVFDLEKAIALFTRLFECKHNVPLYIDSIDGTNSMNSLGMDVIAPASEDGLYGRMMQRIGEGLSAVSFYVEDLDDATRKIEATGIRKVSEIGFPEIERQTQFHAKDCFGMSLELVYLYPGATEKMAAMQASQAKDNDGKPHIEALPGAVPTGGIHHVRLRVKSVEDLETAIRKFESWFECSWQRAPDGKSATSSLDVHLFVSEDGTQGIDAFAMAVPDLEAAVERGREMGLSQLEIPPYLREIENAVCFAPSDCFGLSLVLVESTMQREHRHH